ncbi:prevent-host-death protein [Actinokineospora pegani]|uniref:prevent-host-death protein n=1 Tax=Actinokineospora pegani TaxID=2654637 RepID=UPI0012EA006A|nr:prevent-host-death protein [Actinokineospora pegani]
MTSAVDLPVATRRSSDLSKHSAEVFAEAEGHTRMLDFAAQLITAVLDETGTLAERMAKVFPWMLALSPADRETCAQDLVDAARASFSTRQPRLAIAELTSWKETAAAIAAGLGSADLEWLDEDEAAETVERP